MIFRPLILVIQFKKLATTKKLKILKKKTPTQDKYITTNEFNMLTKANFAERLKQVNLVGKSDIATAAVNFAKMDQNT